MNYANKKTVISILGCGWYGMPLGQALIQEGYDIKGSTTSVEKLKILSESGLEPYLVTVDAGKITADPAFFECDILIVNVPPKVSSSHPDDYPKKMRHLVHAAKKVKNIIFISSTGVYADENITITEEREPCPSSDSGKALLEAEKIFTSSTAVGTIIRFGGLIGPNRTLAKHFAGRKSIPNGLAPINLIHLTDCIALTIAIIRQKAFGEIYHGVLPDHPTRAEFYTENCLAHGMAKPEFLNELLDWKKMESINVPKINYHYHIRKWDEWLKTEYANHTQGL